MSSKRPRGLGGNGLSSLIPNVTEVTNAPVDSTEKPDTSVIEGASAVYAELDIQRIIPNPRQPRVVFDEDAMSELVHSIKEIGLLQPIVVRRIEPVNGADFEIVAGERRWRASQQAGLTQIPTIIRQTSDDDLLRDSLLENLHRAQLNPLEEANAYQQLLSDFGCTQEELSTRIGRSRPQISNTIRLLRLPAAIQRRVAAGVLSAGHARALLSLESDEAMEKLAARIVAEGLSVRATEEIVALGVDGKEKKQRNKPKPMSAPGLKELADRLADRLDTRVSVDMKRNKGSVNIEFATFADLQRIVEIIEG